MQIASEKLAVLRHDSKVGQRSAVKLIRAIRVLEKSVGSDRMHSGGVDRRRDRWLIGEFDTDRLPSSRLLDPLYPDNNVFQMLRIAWIAVRTMKGGDWRENGHSREPE
jgi:hypothetical protein